MRDVGLLQFKNEESGARDAGLAGLPVPVKENLFLIGLSNLAGRRRAQHRPARAAATGSTCRSASRRASAPILSFEKGVSGEQVVNDAFRQWR